MKSFLREFFSTNRLSPHGICLTWRPELVWTHVISDAIIGFAYFSIPVVLATFVSKRRDISYAWVFWCFVAFILACGTTHFMSIWTLWVPDYGLEAAVKAVTATVSVATAVSLWVLLPDALTLPSPSELRGANEMLQAHVAERDRALLALRQANARRENAEGMLRQAQKMEAIGHLTSGIAHDFNNLLGVIKGNLEYLERRSSLDERSIKSINSAWEATSRAATLVHRLLAFARQQPLIPVRVNVDSLIRGIMPLLSNVVPSSQIALDLDAGEAAIVDPNQLENALLNLMVNARDAMSLDSIVTVRTRPRLLVENEEIGLAAGNYIMVEVADTGSGMTLDVLERAFDPFYTTKKVGQGTGLGLSQVFGFARQSGGTVCLRSDVGVGTCVTIFVPKAMISIGDTTLHPHLPVTKSELDMPDA